MSKSKEKLHRNGHLLADIKKNGKDLNIYVRRNKSQMRGEQRYQIVL
jgi:hypothetical protein